MNEDKATRYHRMGRRASVVSGAWTLTLLGGLMISGTSVGLRQWAEDAASLKFYLNEYQPLIVGLYVLALSIIFDIALLPISFYKGFVLERRYGLATQTAAHWLKDYVKAVVIGLLFAEAGAEFVYYTIRRWPDWWWAVSGVGYAAVTVALVNLAPVLILPLFFRFTPLDKVSLRDRLTALAAKANTKVMGVYEWRLSDRTKKANAALAGMGNTRRIILSDTLLAAYSDDEIEVILAHELAHHVHRDIWKAVTIDTVLTFAGFYAAHRALRAIVPYVAMKGIDDPAGIPLLLLAAGALALLVKPLMNAQSRNHERRADAYALSMTKNPSAFISAMRRLGQQNLAEDHPSRLVQAFFYTHPPISERLRAAEEWAVVSR
jgi:STE24 endopeptidase